MKKAVIMALGVGLNPRPHDITNLKSYFGHKTSQQRDDTFDKETECIYIVLQNQFHHIKRVLPLAEAVGTFQPGYGEEPFEELMKRQISRLMAAALMPSLESAGGPKAYMDRPREGQDMCKKMELLSTCK